MKQRSCLWALALLWAVTQAAPAWAAKQVVAGVVIVVEGKPQVRPAGTGGFKPLKLNQFVYEGDQVKTLENDRLSIAFIGGAEVRISINSTFTLESGGGRSPTTLKTTIGKAWTRLLHGKAGLNIKTPSAVAAVRGTEADIESGERTTVKVYEGFVDVFNDHGKQALVAGQMTQASVASAPEPARAMAADERGTWQDGLKSEGVEKQIERLQSEADRRRNLELETKDGKKIKLQFEKK